MHASLNLHAGVIITHLLMITCGGNTTDSICISLKSRTVSLAHVMLYMVENPTTHPEIGITITSSGRAAIALPLFAHVADWASTELNHLRCKHIRENPLTVHDILTKIVSS